MNVQQKTCTGCECPFAATSKYFWRDKHEPDGLRKRCKQCCRETPAYIRRCLGSTEAA